MLLQLLLLLQSRRVNEDSCISSANYLPLVSVRICPVLLPVIAICCFFYLSLNSPHQLVAWSATPVARTPETDCADFTVGNPLYHNNAAG